MHLRALGVVFAVCILVSACSCDPSDGSRVDTGSGDGSLGDGSLGDGGLGDGSIDGASCRPSQRFRFGQCVPSPASCAAGEECQNDSCCVEGECIPFGVGPCGDFNSECRGTAPPGDFVPQLECEWLFEGRVGGGPFSTIVVGDFDMDDDPMTVRPSMAFVAASTLYVVDGSTCALQFSEAASYDNHRSPAIGDITGDGRPELIAYGGGVVRAFGFVPAAGTFERLWESAPTPVSQPSIHDLDDDGVAEVIVAGRVFDHRGSQVIDGIGGHSIFADVDADGVIEMIVSSGVYEANFEARRWELEPYWTHPSSYERAFSVVADFGDFGDGEGIAEIVWVGGRHVTVSRIDGTPIFGPLSIPASSGGPPTAADFDGDGQVEFSVTNSTHFVVYDFECLAEPRPAHCVQPGVRWRQPILEANGVTASSVFDFEGDGAAEVVYADHCYLRVYDGATGRVRFSVARSSGTAFEYPVIADVDGDFNSEIVVGSNRNGFSAQCTNPFDPYFTGPSCEAPSGCASPLHECIGGVCRATRRGSDGVQVYGDLEDQWVSSRPIWNQYEYHVTHVRDDGSIPRTSEWQRNWVSPTLNNFRQNSQGIGGATHAAADLTIRPNHGWDCSGRSSQSFEVSVCNRGLEPVGSGVPVTFYAGRTSICPASRTTTILRSGECEDISCVWESAPAEPIDIVVVADDSRAGFGVTYRECREGNNEAIFAARSCYLE